MRLPLISFAAILTVCACGHQDPVSNGASAAATGAPTPNKPVPSAAGGPSQNDHALAAPAAPASGTTIPLALQGRWGLTPADCTSALGDAKGLLVVNPTELRFYESRALPLATAEVRGDSIRGDFRFTGEGQTWTRFERLELRDGNLVRTESNPAASYTYAKC